MSVFPHPSFSIAWAVIGARQLCGACDTKAKPCLCESTDCVHDAKACSMPSISNSGQQQLCTRCFMVSGKDGERKPCFCESTDCVHEAQACSMPAIINSGQRQFCTRCFMVSGEDGKRKPCRCENVQCEHDPKTCTTAAQNGMRQLCGKCNTKARPVTSSGEELRDAKPCLCESTDCVHEAKACSMPSISNSGQQQLCTRCFMVSGEDGKSSTFI